MFAHSSGRSVTQLQCLHIELDTGVHYMAQCGENCQRTQSTLVNKLYSHGGGIFIIALIYILTVEDIIYRTVMIYDRG